ncbi:MAG: hypothetical protein CYPHOPRED_004259 [Cyphobasidiales sp. Tagirdzhanova-0007]|nr:MAG: hypothetical protein CYPHOPRED_004259 [Cyphobasidiales sp. Tagirdzhanova-0007]
MQLHTRLFGSCVCQQVRQASTSTRTGLFSRIRAKADRAAVNMRPAPARVEREVQRMGREAEDGSLFERTVPESQSMTSTSMPTGVRGPWTEHKTSTGNIPISHRKLNDVARLIARKPIDSAILQMQMSDKRVAKTRIKSMLVLARDHAIMKGLRRQELVVREAWVSKGVYLKRLDIKGRGRHGIKMRPEARMHVVLSPGLSHAGQKQQEFEKRVTQRLRTGAGFVREDRPLINLDKLAGNGAGWAW